MSDNRAWVKQMFEYAEQRDIRETFETLSDAPQFHHRLPVRWQRSIAPSRVTTRTDKSYQPTERSTHSTFPTWSLADRRVATSLALDNPDHNANLFCLFRPLAIRQNRRTEH